MPPVIVRNAFGRRRHGSCGSGWARAQRRKESCSRSHDLPCRRCARLAGRLSRYPFHWTPRPTVGNAALLTAWILPRRPATGRHASVAGDRRRRGGRVIAFHGVRRHRAGRLRVGGHHSEPAPLTTAQVMQGHEAPDALLVHRPVQRRTHRDRHPPATIATADAGSPRDESPSRTALAGPCWPMVPMCALCRTRAARPRAIHLFAGRSRRRDALRSRRTSHRLLREGRHCLI